MFLNGWKTPRHKYKIGDYVTIIGTGGFWIVSAIHSIETKRVYELTQAPYFYIEERLLRPYKKGD